MPRQRWRFIAQRALTNQFLHYNVPLTRETMSWDLSGPGQLVGTISPEVAQLRAADGLPLFDEWNTYLYAELDGEIRWGGIFQNSGFAGASWQITAAGFCSYPAGIDYAGAVYNGLNANPVSVFNLIWSHVQAQPDGNIGVSVVNSGVCPIRIGTVDEPYQLNWWEARDCGSELATLAEETPFDWVETHAWSGESIVHRVTTGYPRHGRRRDDIAFVQGANIDEPVTVDRDGSRYANAVTGIGKGEGQLSVRAPVAIRDGRLRRPVTLVDKTAGTTARMAALARAEMNRRRLLPTISSITVKQHPNARIGSWQLGDDVLVRAQLPWLGLTEIWCRILGWELITDNRARLTLARSDSFDYGTP